MRYVSDPHGTGHGHPRNRPASSRLAGGSWWAVRIVATLHGLAAVGQPTFAGAYLGGNYDMLALHSLGADTLTSLSYLQLIVAVLLWILGGVRWPALVTMLLVLAETGQYVAGMAGAMELHIPLGVAVVAGSLFLVITLWRVQGLRSLSGQDSRSLSGQDSRSLSLSKGKPDDPAADR